MHRLRLPLFAALRPRLLNTDRYLSSCLSKRPVRTRARRPSRSTEKPAPPSRSWAGGRRAALPPAATTACRRGPSRTASVPKHVGVGVTLSRGEGERPAPSLHSPFRSAGSGGTETRPLPSQVEWTTPPGAQIQLRLRKWAPSPGWPALGPESSSVSAVRLPQTQELGSGQLG